MSIVRQVPELKSFARHHTHYLRQGISDFAILCCFSGSCDSLSRESMLQVFHPTFNCEHLHPCTTAALQQPASNHKIGLQPNQHRSSCVAHTSSVACPSCNYQATCHCTRIGHCTTRHRRTEPTACNTTTVDHQDKNLYSHIERTITPCQPTCDAACCGKRRSHDQAVQDDPQAQRKASSSSPE
jgi:hypothetical protein